MLMLEVYQQHPATANKFRYKWRAKGREKCIDSLVANHLANCFGMNCVCLAVFVGKLRNVKSGSEGGVLDL